MPLQQLVHDVEEICDDKDFGNALPAVLQQVTPMCLIGEYGPAVRRLSLPPIPDAVPYGGEHCHQGLHDESKAKGPVETRDEIARVSPEKVAHAVGSWRSNTLGPGLPGRNRT